MFKELLNEKYLTRTLIVLAVLYFIAGLNFDMNIYDEGISLTGAWRLANGELPYRDFWTIYSPLNYYLIAGFSLLIASTVMSVRLLAVLVAILTVFFNHKLIRIANKNRPKFTSGLVLIITVGYSLFFAKAMGPAILFSSISILFLIKPFIQTENPKQKVNSFFSGFFGGLVFLTRLDTGLLLIISLFLSLLVFFILRRRSPDNKNEISIANTVYLIIAGLLTSILPVVVFFLIYVPANLIYEQLVAVPMTIYTQYRKIPRIHIWDIVHAVGYKNAINIIWFGIYSLLPGAVTLLILFKLRKNKLSHTSADNRIYITIPLMIFGFLLISQTIIRPDNEHFLPSWIFSISALFAFFDNTFISKRYRYVFNVIILFFVAYFLTVKSGILTRTEGLSYSAITKIPRADKILINDKWKKDLESTVEFIQKNTTRKEKIFVSNDRHDMGYRNDALFYFLAERLPATRYHELHPGIVSTTKVQSEIINELKTNKVKFIVRVYTLNDYKEPNLSSKSSGIFLLDKYIDRSYQIIQRFGMYEILESK